MCLSRRRATSWFTLMSEPRTRWCTRSTNRSPCCGPNRRRSRTPTSGCWRLKMFELNAMAAIAGRDVLKFSRDPGRLVAAVVFPFTMIFLLGGTLQLNLGKSAGFAFTGFLGMTLFQSTAQGLTSLMEDRQNDFAQEVFVSPVSRYSIVFGKIMGETLVALIQVIPFVLFAWVLRVPLTPAHVALLLPVALLSCFMGGAFGLLLLNTMSDTRASNQIFNFVFLPQYFLAGMISPINNLPWYLELASLASPMRYVIDLARGVVFAGSPDYRLVLLLNPVTNVAVLALMLGVFLIVGTTLFVRRETNR